MVRCVLLATMGRCGAICSATTVGAVVHCVLLATMGCCGALCPIDHYGALWCVVSYWPLGGAVVHCVLLAAMGLCGAIYTATTMGRCDALSSIDH